jgi:hypothetical protein
VSGGKDGRGRADALKCEAGEGLEDDSDSGGDEDTADDAKGSEAEKGRVKDPVRDPPGDEACDDAGARMRKAAVPKIAKTRRD